MDWKLSIGCKMLSDCKDISVWGEAFLNFCDKNKNFLFSREIFWIQFFACFWTDILSNFPELVCFSPPTHTRDIQSHPIQPTLHLTLDKKLHDLFSARTSSPICCWSSRSGGVGMLCTFGSGVYSAQPQISSCFLHPPARHMGPEWGKNRLLPLTRLLTTSTTSTTEWRWGVDQGPARVMAGFCITYCIVCPDTGCFLHWASP